MADCDESLLENQDDQGENEVAVGYQETASGQKSSFHEGSESIDEVYAQLAQKERDLLLAAELGKALLDSNQELQSRYDQLLEDFNSKVENLQQEKYNLHLDFEKLETEHQNRVKDLQDDASALREQLRETSQHRRESQTEATRSLLEAQQKSEYLAEQVQQAGQKEEKLLEKLEEEKEKHRSSQLVIQDHLEHITMLREQVEYLSEKLKEATQALRDSQEENELLLKREKTLMKQLQSQETSDKPRTQVRDQTQRQPAAGGSVHPHPSSSTSSQVVSGNLGKSKGDVQMERSGAPQGMDGFHGYQNINFSEFHPTSLFKPVAIPCRTGELVASNRSSPISISESASAVQQKSPVPGTSVLAEFSTPFRHMRNRSDCSISSMTEGSRKRHYETIALNSDEEDEGLERNVKTAHCKQSLLSKLIDSSNAQAIQAKAHRSSKKGGDLDTSFTSGSPTSGSMFEESKESGFSQAVSLSGDDESSSTTQALDIPDSTSVPSSSERVWSESHTYLPRHDRGKRPGEMSLFEELSSHSMGVDRQDSGASERSLFDEISDEVQSGKSDGQPDFPTSCLLSRPDFFGHSHWLEEEGDEPGSLVKPVSQHTDLKQSDSDSNYTCEWPLLSSVSADMLEDDDDDDFECDDDDFLVGNKAGSTLSIGDSGVGPTLKSYHSSLDAEPLDTSDPWMGSGGNRWAAKAKQAGVNNEALEEACKQLRQLVVRLGGADGGKFGQVDLANSPDSGQNSNFDRLLALIHELKNCVDQFDPWEVPHLKTKTDIEEGLRRCLLKEERQRFLGSSQSEALRRGISSSSLLIRRSL